jgi:hypothetical protein
MATQLGGISVVTTAWAPMTALDPMHTPVVIVALAPIQTLSPIRMGAVLRPWSMIRASEEENE